MQIYNRERLWELREEKILWHLKYNLTAQEIAERIGLSYGQTLYTLKKMRGKGLVTNEQRRFNRRGRPTLFWQRIEIKTRKRA